MRIGTNHQLCLVNPFCNFGWFLPIFNKEKVQEQIRGYFASKWKEDEFEGTSVINLEFVEEISDVLAMNLLGK